MGCPPWRSICLFRHIRSRARYPTIREQPTTIGDVTTAASSFSARHAYNPNGTVAEAEFYNGGSPATAKRYRYLFPAYDALNRLQSADFSTWSGSAWTSTLAFDVTGMQYDGAGNIMALQRYGPGGTLLDNLTYAYTAGTNRLAAVTDLVGGTGETWDAESGGFTYDATGNMVTGPAPYGMTAVTYDHRNLPLVLTANGVTSAYRYHEQGQRISKQVGGGNSEYYVLDGRTALGVVTVDGVGTAVTWTWNVLAGDKVVGRETNTAQRFYYHTDLLGSTRVVVQGATVVEAYDYDPWGVRLDGRTVAGATKEGFTTKERDAESGLDYFGARYYMAALGRWTSVDPLSDQFVEWSPYTYTFDSPSSAIDPLGLEPESVVLTGQDAQDYFRRLQSRTALRRRQRQAVEHPADRTLDARAERAREVHHLVPEIRRHPSVAQLSPSLF